MSRTNTEHTAPHAVILAEGGNRQLRPLTEHLPTCLVPVGGTPILDHQIQALRREGIEHITVVGGFRGALVEQACRHYPEVRYGFNPEYSRESPAASSLRVLPLGETEPLLLLRGDLLFDATILQDLLSQGKDARVLDSRGRPVGMVRLGHSTFQALSEDLGSGDIPPAADLFDEVEERLSQAKAGKVEAGDRPWARVESMIDLARAMKAHRASAQALVARAEKELAEDGKPAAEEPKVLPGPGDARWDPMVDADELVVRPLLKAIQR